MTTETSLEKQVSDAKDARNKAFNQYHQYAQDQHIAIDAFLKTCAQKQLKDSTEATYQALLDKLLLTSAPIDGTIYRRWERYYPSDCGTDYVYRETTDLASVVKQRLVRQHGKHSIVPYYPM
jgi:hypothetical protein